MIAMVLKTKYVVRVTDKEQTIGSIVKIDTDRIKSQSRRPQNVPSECTCLQPLFLIALYRKLIMVGMELSLVHTVVELMLVQLPVVPCGVEDRPTLAGHVDQSMGNPKSVAVLTFENLPKLEE